MPRARDRLVSGLMLAVVGVLLLYTAVPGVFTIDEDAYLTTVVALRAGRVTLPFTDGLPPEQELVAFDAAPRSVVLERTPVPLTAPPLYAPIALPFAGLGFFGLIVLEILAFVVCGGLVFAYTATFAETRRTPWVALAAFVLGSFSVEYALGAWPHMLAAALGLAALVACGRVRAGGPLWLALVAGIAAGLAAGVRYQNLVFGVLVGLGLLLAPARRLWAVALFAAGLALPLAASSAINAERLGSWNPISKGSTYLESRAGGGAGQRLGEAALSTWARVVDHSTWPRPKPGLHELASILTKERGTGAFVFDGVVKKALLQSSPWLLIPLLGVFAVWLRRGPPSPAQRELHAIGLVVAGVLALFAFYGFSRTDAWCYNQRYLLELMPLLAVALAWLSDADAPPAGAWMGGALVGAVGAAAILRGGAGSATRHLLILQVPLALAVAAVAVWLLVRVRRVDAAFLGVVAGACIGYAAGVHLLDDVPASRTVRQRSMHVTAAFDRALPDDEPAAIFAYWGKKDPLGPLLLDHDLVVADPWVDSGRGARRLSDALLDAGRKVYVVAASMPPNIVDALLSGRRAEPVDELPGVLRVRAR